MKSLMSLLLHLMLVITTFSSGSMVKAQTYEATHAGLKVSATSVVLANVGYSVYIDAKMMSKDGSSVDVTESASWSSANTSIALTDTGRILGLKKGSTIVTVSYNGYKKTIGVTIKNNVNLEKEYAITGGAVISTKDVPSDTRELRNEILERCSNMINFKWRPVKTLRGFDGYVFHAGVTQSGIPYSYTDNLTDQSAFGSALSYSDFYKNMVIKGVSQPSYGSDCSGFVSLVWQLAKRYNTEMFIDDIRNGTFAKVGRYNAYNPSRSDLKKAYASLRPGDAVVMREGTHGHTYIVAANESTWATPQIFAYEQTPPYSQFTNHTYDEMAGHGFLPFTLKSLTK